MDTLQWFTLHRFYGQYGHNEMCVASYLLKQERYFVSHGKIVYGDEFFSMTWEIATATYLSESTVKRALNKLADAGVISRRKGKNKVWLRILKYPKPAEAKLTFAGKGQNEPCGKGQNDPCL